MPTRRGCRLPLMSKEKRFLLEKSIGSSSLLLLIVAAVAMRDDAAGRGARGRAFFLLSRLSSQEVTGASACSQEDEIP